MMLQLPVQRFVQHLQRLLLQRLLMQRLLAAAADAKATSQDIFQYVVTIHAADAAEHR